LRKDLDETVPAPSRRRPLGLWIAAASIALGAAAFAGWKLLQRRTEPAPAASVPEVDTTGFEVPVQEIIAQARRDVVANPTSARTWARFATVLDAHRLGTPAEFAYRRALEIGPEDRNLSYNLAFLLEARGKTAESLSRYRRFAQDQPNYPPVHFRIGAVLAMQGDMKGAAESYRTALALDPALLIARRALGQVLIALDDAPAAAAELERVAATAPEDGPTQAALTQVYRRLGDEARAAEAMRRSRDATDKLTVPDAVRFFVLESCRSARQSSARAASRMHVKDYAGAVEDLKIVLRTRGQDPAVHERLADAYRHLGLSELADQQIAEAQRLRGDH